MLRSLRGRLLVLLFLLVIAAIATGVLMVDLYQQSATAKIAQANSERGRACDAIVAAYRLSSINKRNEQPDLAGTDSRQELIAVVSSALLDHFGVEGGIWQATLGPIAYAFPTYVGAGPKTDLPQAEIPRIRAVNKSAMDSHSQGNLRFDGADQSVLFTACPISGSIPGLTAWTMNRVHNFGSQAYRQLLTGLGVLLAAVGAATIILTWLTTVWSRHIAQIERLLSRFDIAELPNLPKTGEAELDRIVIALNEAGRRLAETHRYAEELDRRLAMGERLAAIGRIAAGVAHEIRNPIATMRLKAENALAGDIQRKDLALAAILEQIERLDGLLRRLLHITEHNKPNPEPVDLASFLDVCAAAHTEQALAKNIVIERRINSAQGVFDFGQMQSAIDNLLLNAIQASPAGGKILVTACVENGRLIFSVIDQGEGPPQAILEHLFEPFVTGRPEGTGLGLSIVREAAKAHAGAVDLTVSAEGTNFRIILPCQLS
jgi:signal transduction histidine kinase